MRYILILALVFAVTAQHTVGAEPGAKLLSVNKIADDAPHSAFTDLIYWHGQFVCAFRQGRKHVSTDGRIRVLTSKDGETWARAAVITQDGFDFRDAGLSETPDGRLMLIGGAAPRKADNDGAPTGSFVAFSDDAKTWTTPKIVSEPGHWLWRVTWHDGKAYGVAYTSWRPLDPEGWTQLLVSSDGADFKPLVEKLLNDGAPTEATLRFAKDGTMYCLQRRDAEPRPRNSFWGESKPPYTEWKWRDMGTHVGGPNFIQLPSGQWLAAGRFFDGKTPRTKLAKLDVEKAAVEPILELPSGGDSSYPGLVWHDGKLYMSYYSSHEGKTSIYMAKIAVE